MALSLTRGEGVTVLTVTSDPKSQVPIALQLLVSLCCSPVCYVSQGLGRLLAGTQRALGTVQIMVGLFNIGLGVILLNVNHSDLFWICAPYWLGGVFIAVGIISILSERFPSPCMVFLTAFMNLASACLAVTAIVLYSVDLASVLRLGYRCARFEPAASRSDRYDRYDRYERTTSSPEKLLEQEQLRWENFELCRDVRHMLLVMLGGIEILLILIAVLQLCVTISAAVLGLKALCKNRREGKPEQDPELYKPLVEEDNPTV
ncbi:transmembrane protein 176B-like [Conger conger]|uniref:transmembrane protein 176B-like n=1 Tax=Conger conger TaxID=82655 RepID=UPI002A5A732E|nr:transmembrane protein 176B-like [Conger conger]